MRIKAYGITVILSALIILIGSVTVLLIDNSKLNNIIEGKDDQIADQSYTIKTLLQDYEQDNRCK